MAIKKEIGSEISVILPIYNGEKYLKDAIESILKQTYIEFEFIIIDDGSTDNSVDIINMYSDKRIKFIKQNNKGLASTLNIGIKYSSGKYIARMDQDDISHPKRIEKQLDFMLNNRNCGVLGTQATVIDMNGSELYRSNIPTDDTNLKRRLQLGTPFFHPSVLLRKDILKKVGGYNEYNRVNEDIELWMKMKELTEFRNLNEHLFFYRITPTSLSLRSKKTAKRIRFLVQKNIKEGLSEFEKAELITKEENTKNDKMFMYNLCIGKIYLERSNNKRKAWQYFKKALWLKPFSSSLCYNIVLLLFPFKFIKKVKKLDYRLY